jgi:hypothetical protein
VASSALLGGSAGNFTRTPGEYKGDFRINVLEKVFGYKKE